MSRVRLDLAQRLRSAAPGLTRRLARADTLAEAIRALNASLEPERVADALIGLVSEWIPAPAWLVVAVDAGGGTRTLASRGLSGGLEVVAQAAAAHVTRRGTPFMSAQAAADLRVVEGSAGAALALPLACRGGIAGAVVAMDRVASGRAPRLGAATLDALLAALEPAAIAIDTAVRVQRAEALSVTDDLTQLYNSRYLSQVLWRETKRTSRSGRPLSLLFIDLDGFKAINDAHGHLFGSRALVEAAGVIRASARETDVAARFGGDEFALVLPDTGSEGAVAAGERVRDRIAGFLFLQGDGLGIRLTASVGVATLPDVAASAEALVHAADEAMYWVKEHGKNGIYVAGSQ